MKLAMIPTGLLLATVEAQASCATIQKLAQEHSNDMARRGSMDHAGFMDRARGGVRAENVAAGVNTRSAAIALWWSSPGHATNMRLPGWAMNYRTVWTFEAHQIASAWPCASGGRIDRG